MNEISELNRIEKDFIKIFNTVVSEDLNIEECRNLFNKLMFLNKEMENLLGNMINTTISKNKKGLINSIIQIFISIICLLISTASPIFFVIAIANIWLMLKNTGIVIEAKRNLISAIDQTQSMEPLINNCITFLNKKIDIACSTPTVNQEKKETDVQNQENIRLMSINIIITTCIYEGVPYFNLEQGDDEIAVRILQSDLGTEETDLNKLIAMAREKVQNELKFTRTLHK